MRGAERTFGLSVGVVCGLVALALVWKGNAASAWLSGLVALALLIPALTRPALLRVPSAIWWQGVHVLGWLNARGLLSVVFFLLFTPAGLLARAGGWDPLHLRRRRASGWVPFPARRHDVTHYEQMY